jgi:hypothetical protein
VRSVVRWFRLTLIMLLTIAASSPGCDRQTVSSSTATQPAAPTTTPADEAAGAAPAPATIPASTQPRVAVMLIEGRRVEFPPAKLVLRAKGGQVYALLFSDDPPTALEPNYRGNSFYFEMTLDVPEPSQLASAQWIYKAPDSERSETDQGIFLNGRQQHLQPLVILIEFDNATAPVKTYLSGQFMRHEEDADPTVPGQLVPVRGELDSDLVVKQ